MANKTKLKVRIPFLLEAAAEGHLAIVLLFALALATITLDRGLALGKCQADTVLPAPKKKREKMLLAHISLSQKQNKQDNQTADCMQICGHLDTNLKHDVSMFGVRGNRRLSR